MMETFFISSAYGQINTALSEYRIAMPYREAEILAAVQKLNDMRGIKMVILG